MSRMIRTTSFLDAMLIRVETSSGEPMGAIEMMRVDGVMRFTPDASLAAWAQRERISPALLAEFVRTTAGEVLDVPAFRRESLSVSPAPKVAN